MSLRDQLRSRERPSLDYELPIRDVMGAKRALASAEEAYRSALGRSDEDAAAAVKAAKKAVGKAEADLDACYAHIKIRALPPGEYEALVALHPPRPGTDDKEWNAETFPKACFLACATELSAEEWEEILAENVSHAEREDLYLLARAVNIRLLNPALPKG